jgi:hypothetical protein
LIHLSITLSLPRDCPGITDVDFESTDELAFKSVSEVVCQWNCLQSFTWHTGKLTHSALIHLANLSNLRDIDVVLPQLDGGNWQGHLPSLQRSGFRALRNVRVVCQHLSSCVSLMDLVSPRCPIESIFVRVTDGHDANCVRKFLQTLNARCSHISLTQFSIVYNSDTWPAPPFADERIIDENTLRPLLGFPNMRVVVIHTPCPFRLGNQILRDIATCWTQLQSLGFGTPGGWGGLSQITLAGLIPLLSLSTLQSLSIVVDASSVDYTLDMPKVGVSNTKIFMLNLGDSLIHNTRSVAAFLSDVLPNVRQIHSWSPLAARNASVSTTHAMKYQSKWESVARWMETIVRVREQERDSVRERFVPNGSTC